MRREPSHRSSSQRPNRSFLSRAAWPPPPRHFFIITSRVNWQKLSRRSEWVFSSESRSRGVQAGDLAVVYLTAQGQHEPALAGLLRFAGPVEPAPDEPFYLVYKHRAPVTILHVAEPPVPFREVKDKLSFIPSGGSYGQVLQGQEMREIEKTDFDQLSGVLSNSGRNPPRFKSNSGQGREI